MLLYNKKRLNRTQSSAVLSIQYIESRLRVTEQHSNSRMRLTTTTTTTTNALFPNQLCTYEQNNRIINKFIYKIQ